MGSSISSLKVHPWFSTIDWDLLLEKKLEVPFNPPSVLEKLPDLEPLVLDEGDEELDIK